MGDDPISPVCDTIGSEYLSGVYPIPIIRTPLVWCINGDVVFLVGSAPHKTTVDDKITRWLGVNKPKETDCHCKYFFRA
jgi:hypothetical protein